MQLTEEQELAKSKILKYIFTPEIKEVLLLGNAGTGKTFTVVKIVEELLKLKKSVGIACPTHKSKNVLETMLKKNLINLKVETIHHVLGLVIIEEHGEIQLMKDWDGTINNYDFVFLDEASMVSDELYNHILRSRAKFIYIGDDAQLPPVENSTNKISRIFDVNNIVKLDTIVRQAENNPIIKISQLLRNTEKRITALTQTVNEENYGVFVLEKDQWEQNLIQEFKSENAKNDFNYCKALAYRNTRVDYLNELVHKNLYPETSQPMIVGEKVVLNTPLTTRTSVKGKMVTKVLVSSGMEGLLTEIKKVKGLYDLDFWQVSILFNNEVKNGFFPVSKVAFMQKLGILKEEALEDKSKWWHFYQLKNYILDISLCYALTVHKSQASTYKNVYLDKDDITSCKNCKIKHKVLYTGITRASDNCFIFQT